MSPGAEDDDEPETPSDNEQKNVTVLPTLVASAISLVTATSSLSLRVGGFFGNAFINGARIGTLTGFELGRTILEGILSRAGRDVADNSSGSIGKIAAESVLDRALFTLHDTITKTSFLVSTSFQIGSTSVSASLGLAQYFLSALDATLGDTETSRAIATIIVLVRREFRNPETGVRGERVGLGDVIIGAIAFALLQRWGAHRTDEELKEKGSEEVIWSLVVTNESVLPAEQPLSLYEPEEMPTNCADRTACMAPTALEQAGEGVQVDDNVSMVSNTTRNFPGSDNLRPELAFQQHLMDQLQPGCAVRVAAQSVITNTVSVEISGDSTAQIDPPYGYTLIAAHHNDSLDSDSQTLVFQNKKRRLRRGSFEISEDRLMSEVEAEHRSGPMEIDESTALRSPTLNAETLAALEASTPPLHSAAVHETKPLVKANEKRPRSPVAARESRIPISRDSCNRSKDLTTDPRPGPSLGDASPRKSAIRKTLTGRTSYKNLVDFWSQHGPHKSNIPRPPSPTQNRRSIPDVTLLQAHRTRPSTDTSVRPSTQSLHRRTSSSWSMISTRSEGTVVLREGVDQLKDVSSMLNREGRLPGQFPNESFAHNTTRFARFSVASYGSRFLRFMGAFKEDPDQIPDFSDRAEHQSFASYSRLPPSTVLVSSFVDPEGGTNASGETDTGMPLTHYISLDHESKAVVLTCRGTLGFEDVLTDATCDYDDFIWGGKVYQVHKGMYASARRLLSLHNNRVTATIKAALEEFKDYGLVLCGHSLGGGVAALIGILLSHPSQAESCPYTTGPFTNTPTLHNAKLSKHAINKAALTLPTGRPIHVYTYGPAATVSPALQRATRGLITTIVNRQDSIPYFSLGTLRDFQAIALAFKTDTRDAKGEVRRRVWEGLRNGIRDRSGLGAFGGIMATEWLADDEEEDHWPWAALKSLRAGMSGAKLVPPGEVFIIEAHPVLQRHAFVSKETGNNGQSSGNASRPATHVKLTHVKDVAVRFGELRFGSSMYTDHIPSRYEKALEALERGMI
ncbi:MAG: hypothetical protein M1828_006213 [Chrysothrix sp. TS-e1954]|nr:MAG: hypothetical protein M1828_006213 [Chrysothrix sp. TS-e1954]